MNRALRAATMGALLLTPVALTACSAGQVNQTAAQDRDKVGPSAQVGDLVLRQVLIVDPGELADDGAFAYETGDAPELMLTIANPGDSDDELVAVEAEGFDGLFTADPTAEEPTTTAAPTTGEDDETPTTGTAPTPAAPTTAAVPTPVDRIAVEIPAGQNVTIGLRQYLECPRPEAEDDRELDQLCRAAEPETSGDEEAEPQAWYATLIDESTPRLFLAGLPDELSPLTAGQTITITLVFREAGEVTVDALVAAPGGVTPRGPAFDFHTGDESSEEQDTEAE